MSFSIAQDLVVLGGDICAADGTVRLSLGTGGSGDVTVASNDLVMTGGGMLQAGASGNVFKNSGGTTALTVDGAGDCTFSAAASTTTTFTVGTDLTVTGNDISGSGGVCLTFSGTNTTTGGTLTTGGNLIVGSSGTTTFNSVAYTWPGADGSSGQVLSTDSAGTLSWADDSSGSARFTVDTTVRTSDGNIATSDAGKTILVNSSSGTVDLVLAAASGFTNGDVIIIKNVVNCDNAIKLTNTGSDTLDGSVANETDVITTLSGSISLVCDGSSAFYIF